MFKTSRGFTLIEVILTITLIGIISVTIGRMLFESYEGYLVSQRSFDLEWQGYLIAQRLADDIHTIRSANDISAASSTQLSFTNINNSSIQYQFSGSSLLRNTQILAANIQSFSFSYLNANGTTTAVLNAIRYVYISVTLNQDGMRKAFTTLYALRGID